MAGETVYLLRPTRRGPHGDHLPGTTERYPIPGSLFAPGPSAESAPNSGANQTDSAATVYPPHRIVDLVPGGPVATDQFEVRGQLYQVVGDPQDWGRHNRMVINLRKVTG